MKIIGTGSAIPSKVVTNEMLTGFLDTSDEWITQRTGIKSRHVTSSEKIEDLGAEAISKALEMSGLKAEDIDLFVCSCVASEYVTPSLCCVIAEKLGITGRMFDINCACPGFVYALDMVESYYKAGKTKNALIACVEEPTRMASWKDRGTCILFGDGAGAVVLTEGDNVKGSKLNSQPCVEKLWETRTLVDTPYITKKEESVPLQMDGRGVFKFAVSACTRDIEAVLNETGYSKDDVDHYLVHQANQRIIESIIHNMGQPASKFPINISDHGNSSSASCPILLDECNRRGEFKKGDLIMFSAFGAGLLSGAALVEW